MSQSEQRRHRSIIPGSGVLTLRCSTSLAKAYHCTYLSLIVPSWPKKTTLAYIILYRYVHYLVLCMSKLIVPKMEAVEDREHDRCTQDQSVDLGTSNHISTGLWLRAPFLSIMDNC